MLRPETIIFESCRVYYIEPHCQSSTDNYTAIMTVSGFVAITMFLVVGISSADCASLADRRLWSQQCSVETGFEPSSAMDAVTATDRRAWCFTACFMRKKGLIKDEKLAKREEVCDNLVEELSHAMVRLKEGRTARQLAEKCYDEANVKNGACEIGGALLNCLQQGMESTRTV